MEQRILSSKLKVPHPRNNYVVRQPLFAKLQSIGTRRLTIVQGGAGSGKSTLLASYIKEKGLSQAKWLSLDAICNNGFIFWNYMIEMLAETLGDAADDYRTFFNANMNPEDFETVLVPLINGLDNDEEQIIILDDFHVITDEHVLAGMQFFLEQVSENIHIVILTRVPPPFYLGKLSMANQLLLISQQELTFGNAEAMAFLKNTLQLQCPDEQVYRLIEEAEGWVGGLQLLAAAGGSVTQAMPLASREVVQEYLATEIFQQLDEEEQYFLVRTAPLSYFNEQISNVIFPDIQFQTLMQKLGRRHLLLQCIDEERGDYRYHHMFADFLLRHFQELPEAEQQRMYRAAAQVYRQLNDLEMAIYFYHKMQQWPEMMTLVMELPQGAEMFAYLEQVPVSAVLDNFDFAYQKFFYHYINMDLATCMEIYELVVSDIETRPEFKPFLGLKLLIDNEAVSLDAEMITLDELDVNATTKILVAVKNAAFLLYQDRFHEALAVIEKAKRYRHAFANIYIDYFIANIQAQIYEELGYFDEAFLIYDKLKKLVSEEQSLKSMLSSYYISITGIFLKQMRLDEAYTSLQDSKELGNNMIGTFMTAYNFNMVEYLFLSGRTQEAATLLNADLLDQLKENLLVYAPILKYAWKLDSFNQHIADIFVTFYLETDAVNRTLNSHLIYARILMSKGNLQAAEALLDELSVYIRQENIHVKIIEVNLLKLAMLKDQKAQIHLYQEAVYYAHKAKIKEPFYLEKDVLVDFLRKNEQPIIASLSDPEIQFHRQIRQLIDGESDTFLSNRELEVLIKISEGLTNQAIADSLYISLATVKTHIINIYRKLEVSSRLQAVEKAYSLGLVERRNDA